MLTGRGSLCEPASSRFCWREYLPGYDVALCPVTRDRRTGQAFFERVEAGALQAYTSVLTFDELAYRLILALVAERYGGLPLDVLREQEVTVLREIVPPVRTALEELTRLPNLHVVEVVADDLFVMTESMERCQLRPRDALHYAVMVRLGCLNIASRDAHFDRIPAVTRYVP